MERKNAPRTLAASGPSVKRLLLVTAAAVAAVALGSPPAPAQQQGQAPQGQQQQSQATEQLQQAEQALRQALQQMQGAQGQQQGQAAQSVRQALTRLQQAMAQIPAERRGGQGYQRLEREVGEAQAALQGDRPDVARARVQVEEVIVAIPVLRAEVVGLAAAAGPPGAAADGAQIVVREASPTVQVQQAQPVVTVQQPEPVITVLVPQPEIIVRQPPPQVTVQMPEPRVAVRQPDPQVRVVETQPQVRVEPGQPQVQVQQAQPRVVVQQAEGQPQVRYEQQGQPVIRMEQQAQAGVGRTQAEATTGAPAPAAAPVQSGGAAGAQPAAAAAGLPLARVSSLMGTNVIGPNGRDAGEVENLLIDRQGNVRAAVIEWGGFLGIGESRAVVPLEQLRFGAAGERVRMELTREQLERLPRYDRNNLGEYATRYGWGEGVRLYR